MHQEFFKKIAFFPLFFVGFALKYTKSVYINIIDSKEHTKPTETNKPKERKKKMKLNNATIASMIRKTFGINITSINENGRLAYWFDKGKKEEAIEKLLNVLCYLIEDGHDKKENIRERMEIVEDGNFGKIYFQLM